MTQIIKKVENHQEGIKSAIDIHKQMLLDSSRGYEKKDKPKGKYGSVYITKFHDKFDYFK